MVNKKICALLVLMMMGTYTISQNSVYAEDTTSETTEVSVIKGNKDAFEMAENLIGQKNYQEALKYLDAYISSKPKKYEAYKLRGDAYYALRRYNLAEKDYQTAIDLKTDDDKFVTGTKVLSAVVLGADKQEQLQNPELGNLYAKLMYAQKAQNKTSYESSYAKAVELNSHIYLPQPKKDEISQINCPQKYGKVFNSQGDDKFLYDAINDIENENYRDSVFKSQYLITNYPDYYLGYYLNGVALAGMEQDEEAIVAFNNALKKNPYDFESLASLGQLHYAQAEKTFSVDDAKKSTEYFRQALKLNPNCNSYYFYIGLNDLLQGKVSSAIESFDSAIKLKSNDYNSQYYKIIAQYINGDYSSVISGAGNLLYRRVSNYNSVMYLKALAEYKQGQSDLALEDLEKIYNSTTDIYNSDVRYVSNKEKTLLGYCYYLKALILAQKGMGTKSDMAEAYSNPIIAQLAATEKMLNTYKPEFVNGKVSLEDYKKFNNAYNSAVGLLKQSNIVITPEDIDTQYDYIRTTFDDLGVTFVYKNPNYKISAIDNYVFKKYSSKLSAEDFQTLSEGVAEDEVLALRPKTNDTPVLAQQTSQEVLLGDEKTTSIAQILATQSLIPMAVPQELQHKVENLEPASIENSQHIENQPQNVQEPVISVAENSSDKTEKIEETPEAENITKTQEPQKIEKPSESIKIVADEIKDSPDFTISYPKEETEIKNLQENVIAESKPESEPIQIVAQPNSQVEKQEESLVVKAQEQIQPEEQNPEKIASNNDDMVVNLPLFDETKPVVDTDEKESLPEQQKPEMKVVEKHADINSEDFGVTPVKPIPKEENPEDVVELEPQSFLYKAEKQVPTASFNIKYPKQVENTFSGLNAKDNVSVGKEEIQSQEEEKIILPEENDGKIASSHSSKTVDLSDKISKGQKNNQITTLPENEEMAVPVVIVPEIKTPEVKVQNVKTPEKLEDEQIQNIEQSPSYDYGDEDKTEQVENTTSPEISQALINAVEGTNSKAKSKVKKEKPVKESKVKAEKAPMVEVGKPEKIKPQKAEKPAKVKKQAVKESVQTPEEKPVKVKTEKVKKEKIKKEKPEKVSEQEKSITSIINNALGIEPLANSTDDVVKSETPVATTKPKREKVQKPIKEPKIKPEKPVKEKVSKTKKSEQVENNIKPIIAQESKQKTSFWDWFKFGKNMAENSEQKVKVKKEKIHKEKLEKEPAVKPVKEVKVKAEKIKADKPQKVVKDKAPKVKTEKAPKVEKLKTPKVKPEKQPKEKKSFNGWFKKDKSQTQNHTKESLSKIFSKSDDQVFEKNEKEKTVIKKLDKKEE